MTALVMVPVLILPLMFVLQELEHWALSVPKGSRRERGRRRERAAAPRAASTRHQGNVA